MTEPGAILFVDDDADIRTSARLLLRRHFATVVTAEAPDELPKLLAAQRFDVILLDMNYALGESSGAAGLAWIPRILERDPEVAVLAVTAFGAVETAVEAMKRGAADFLTKPWHNDKLVAAVRAGLRRKRTEPAPDDAVIYRSDAMREVLALVERAAPTDANVLVLGENGTGKEVIAREVHRRSRRAAAPLVSVDLGALAEGVFESALFGHRRGAFTDAREDRVGVFAAAHGGTLFLDEIGNLPLRLQAKLLTVLERRVVVPLGATEATAVDVRVISATNLRDEQLHDDQVFRQDLRYRLDTVAIRIPPLRARRDDIPVLLEHFIARFARRYDRPLATVSRAALARLTEYPWPGNVRELAHAVERAIILAGRDELDEADFRLTAPAPAAGNLNLEELEKAAVTQALHKHGWNVSHAARELGITRTSLYRRMEKYGL